jgi:multidrug efflux pump subunit AcrA (membrane-fusion protein)
MEVVSEGETVASIIDPTSMIFAADVPSSSSRLIRQGERARIRFSADRGKSYPGTVHRIEQQVNTADQTVRVQITFDAKVLKLAGSLFGEADIVVGTRSNIILVPTAAILRDDERNAASVVVVGTDSLTAASTSSQEPPPILIQVSSPLIGDGSVVITQGHYGLPDSTIVTIVQ